MYICKSTIHLLFLFNHVITSFGYMYDISDDIIMATGTTKTHMVLLSMLYYGFELNQILSEMCTLLWCLQHPDDDILMD